MKVSIYEPLFLPGNFSGVRAEFTFERSCSYFLIEMYGMSVVLVAISWMGFLVPLDQTAARIALGITSVLTEVAILNIMNNAMPKVCDHLRESNTIIFFHCLHTNMVSGNDVIQCSKFKWSNEPQLSGQFHWKFFQQLTSSGKLCFLNGLRHFQCLYSYILISTNELMRKL